MNNFATFDVKQNNTDELNHFLNSHRILSTCKTFNQIDGSWSFCIEYIPDANFEKDRQKKKIDYREILNIEDFAKLRALRDTRAAISKEQNVPAFVIFLDSELVSLLDKEITKENMLAINGFGEQKFNKYGNRFIELWNSAYKMMIPTYIEKEKEFRKKNEKTG